MKSSKIIAGNNNCLQIVPYRPEWPIQFKQIATLLKDATNAWDTSIYHIGSTAVGSHGLSLLRRVIYKLLLHAW
ncbi:GrpB family protein [Dyadobacter chenhuakuii]|uniref:GrpB family protein n=1 Tax=Dyadobacter chenhuakuii TaxID=2909339 RepID=UPI0035B69FF9